MKFKPITPNPHDVAFLRQRMMSLIRRMQADYNRWLKPLVKKMGKEEREEATERIEEAQAAHIERVKRKVDAVEYLTAFEASQVLHTLKSKVIQACQEGKIEGAINQDGEWLMPEDKLVEYGESIGRIRPAQDPMELFNERLENLNRKYESLIQNFVNTATEFTERMFKDAKKKFMKQFEKQVGIDVLKQLSERGLKEAFEAQIQSNVELIKSVPATYFKRIQEMVIANSLGQKKFEGGIVNAIQELTHTTRNRAKLIARDQSAKAVSTFTQLRYQNLGCEKYIWRNSGDRRVAGNPNGLYPDPNPKSTAHGNHWDREGKVFFWKKPPPDGHPGMAINCRCFAEPVFDFEKE